LESKSVEEIMDSKKNFLNTAEVSAVLGVAPSTFRKRAGEYAEKFPIERIGKKYRIPKEPFVAYVRTGKSFK
jgi:predicted transcriptional regulator of viral defense system